MRDSEEEIGEGFDNIEEDAALVKERERTILRAMAKETGKMKMRY